MNQFPVLIAGGLGLVFGIAGIVLAVFLRRTA